MGSLVVRSVIRNPLRQGFTSGFHQLADPWRYSGTGTMPLFDHLIKIEVIPMNSFHDILLRKLAEHSNSILALSRRSAYFPLTRGPSSPMKISCGRATSPTSRSSSLRERWRDITPCPVAAANTSRCTSPETFLMHRLYFWTSRTMQSVRWTRRS